MQNTVLWTLAVLAAALLLAACGGNGDGATPTPAGPTPTEAPPPPDSCALFSQEDAAMVLGEPSGSPRPETIGPVSSCWYTGASTGASVTVQTQRVTAEQFATIVRIAAETAGVEAEEISDLGDEAFAVDDTVIARVGDVYIQAFVAFAEDEADTAEAALQATQIAVANLE